MSSYYDLGDILMEDEPVSAVFLIGANGVGVIDPGSEDENVQAGASVDLPIWLAQELFYRQSIHIKLPYFYDQRLRKEMQADPACVDLQRCSPYFYGLGCKLVPLLPDKSLGSFLLFALQGRYKDILCKAHSSSLTMSPKFLSLMTKEEIALFEAGRNSMRAFNKWRFQGTRLERAPILGRKRRHNNMFSPVNVR